MEKQPYIIGCGNNRNAVHDYKVVVDDKPLDTNCKSITAEYDFLFKVFFVFNIGYPVLDFYRFVQHFFITFPYRKLL